MDLAMFKGALTAVVSSEFADVPDNDDLIDIQPSINFKKKMEKLIKKEKRVVWRYTNTAYKRVAILVAVLVMMFATACSVSAIREPIVEFFTEVYESFTRYFFEGETIDKIEQVYEITELPKGYELKKSETSDVTVFLSYENELGERIIFTQSITNGSDPTVDAEKGETKELVILDKAINLYVSEHITQAFWIEDNYFMSLSYDGNVNDKIMIELIKSVKVKQ